MVSIATPQIATTLSASLAVGAKGLGGNVATARAGGGFSALLSSVALVRVADADNLPAATPSPSDPAVTLPQDLAASLPTLAATAALLPSTGKALPDDGNSAPLPMVIPTVMASLPQAPVPAVAMSIAASPDFADQSQDAVSQPTALPAPDAAPTPSPAVTTTSTAPLPEQTAAPVVILALRAATVTQGIGESGNAEAGSAETDSAQADIADSNDETVAKQAPDAPLLATATAAVPASMVLALTIRTPTPQDETAVPTPRRSTSSSSTAQSIQAAPLAASSLPTAPDASLPLAVPSASPARTQAQDRSMLPADPIVLEPVLQPSGETPSVPAPAQPATAHVLASHQALSGAVRSQDNAPAALPAQSAAAPSAATSALADPVDSDPQQGVVATAPATTVPPALSLASPDVAAAPAATPATSSTLTVPAAQVAALVDAVAQAREAAPGASVAATINHATFGRVSLAFHQEDNGLTVTMASADPGFAPAVLAASRTEGANGGAPNGNPPSAGQSSTGQSSPQNPTGSNGQGASSQGGSHQANPARRLADDNQASAPTGNEADDGSEQGVFA